MVPLATFKITGTVSDFSRVDNIYRSLKREGEKLLDNWTIELSVSYEENKGERE